MRGLNRGGPNREPKSANLGLGGSKNQECWGPEGPNLANSGLEFGPPEVGPRFAHPNSCPRMLLHCGDGMAGMTFASSRTHSVFYSSALLHHVILWAHARSRPATTVVLVGSPLRVACSSLSICKPPKPRAPAPPVFVSCAADQQ